MRGIERLAPGDVARVAVHQQGVPAVIEDQIRSVALEPVARTEFHGAAIRRAEQGEQIGEQIQENPILAILAEGPGSTASKGGSGAPARASAR